MSTIAYLFLIAGSVQLLFIVLFLVAFSKSKQPSTTREQHPISVIVCAHDEETNLRTLLPILLEQNYPAFEIILVEDRSNDGTYDYLLEVSRQHPTVRIVRVQQKPEHVNGKKFALTLGIRAAMHEWLVLTDADCQPQSADWLLTLSRYFTDAHQIVLGYSPYQNSSGLLNSFVRYEGLLTGIQYIGMALLGTPYMGVGRNIAYRKSLFMGNKGFYAHQHLTGGDDDLFVNAHATRTNTAVCIDEGALVLSHPKKTWSDYYYQKIRHLGAGRYYKLKHRLVLGTFTLSGIGFWLLLIPALLLPELRIWIVSVGVLRLGMLTYLGYVASRKLRDSFEVWKVPFLDFIYAFYYLVTGLAALQSKRIRWKKS